MAWLTVKEAAEWLDISEAAVRKRIQRCTLAHRRSDGHVFVYRDVDETADETCDETPERTSEEDGATLPPQERTNDRQLESQVHRIIREELGKHAETISSTIDKNRILHAVAAAATSISVIFAALALVLSVYTYYSGTKREADIAASEALMRHFNYAASQGHLLPGKKSNASGSGSKYDSVVVHGIYTANTIIDVTETTDERTPWQNTVEHMLLTRYEGDISENLSCNELDSRFIGLLETHFSNKALCQRDGPTPTGWERWWQWWEERPGRGQ